MAGADDEEDLAQAMRNSKLSFDEDQQWDEVKEFVLEESARGEANVVIFV